MHVEAFHKIRELEHRMITNFKSIFEVRKRNIASRREFLESIRDRCGPGLVDELNDKLQRLGNINTSDPPSLQYFKDLQKEDTVESSELKIFCRADSSNELKANDPHSILSSCTWND